MIEETIIIPSISMQEDI